MKKESKDVAKSFYSEVKRICYDIRVIHRNNKDRLYNRLDGDDRKRMNAVISNCETNRYTGIYRKPIKNRKRFMQFIHLILLCPVKKKEDACAFSFQSRVVKKYMSAITTMLKKAFSENGKYILGIYIRPHRGFKDKDCPDYHFHVVISCTRIRETDRDYVKQLLGMPLGERPFHSLYLFDKPIIDKVEDIETLLDKPWKRIVSIRSKISQRELNSRENGLVRREDGIDEELENELERAINGDEDSGDAVEIIDNMAKELLGDTSLVAAISRSAQNDVDRDRLAKYAVNPGSHTFRRIRPKLVPGNKEVVRLEYLDEDGVASGNWTMDAVDFLMRYVLNPNKSLGLRCMPKGFLHSSSPMSKAIDQFLLLGLARDDTEDTDRKAPVKVADLPIRQLKSRAAEFREAYLGRELDRLEALKRQYISIPDI